MYDIYAPIIPYVGMGGFLLNMSKEEVETILERPLGAGELIRQGELEEYMIDDILSMYFSPVDGRLKGLVTQKGYRGLLMGKISTETNEKDLLTLDPTLEYDDFEEFYESYVNGYQLETNLPDEKAEWISIFSKEWKENKK